MTSDLDGMAMPAIVVNDRLADQVAEALRTAIMNGTLTPGAHLSVPAIARRMNVSRTPARDALFRLESEGLVEVIPRRGAVVLAGKHDDLTELFELREALEGMAARLAAQRRDRTDLTELRAAFDAHADAVEHLDAEAHIRHDARFHELLAAASSNRRIAEQLSRTRDQLQLLTRAMSVKPGALDDRVIAAHRATLEAIEAGDARAAERAARSHVRGILDFYLDTLRQPAEDAQVTS